MLQVAKNNAGNPEAVKDNNRQLERCSIERDLCSERQQGSPFPCIFRVNPSQLIRWCVVPTPKVSRLNLELEFPDRMQWKLWEMSSRSIPVPFSSSEIDEWQETLQVKGKRR